MKKLIFIFLLHLSTLLSYSQWYKSEGISGGDVSYLVCQDSIMLAAIDNKGIYRKTTNTAWEKVNIYNNYVKLLKAGNCIIALNGNSPLRSFDGGANWETVYNVGSWTYANVIDSVVFWGTGLKLRSFDYGNTYDTIELPPPPTDSYMSYSYTCDSFFYVLYQSGDYEEVRNLYYSNNYGNTWDSITSDGVLEQEYLLIDEIYYLNGTFWAEINMGTGPSAIVVLDSTSNQWVYTSSEHNLNGCRDMTYYAGKVLLSAWNHPVHYFEDSTLQWKPFTTPQKIVNEFVIHNGELYTATEQGVFQLDSTGIYYDINDGFSFRTIGSISCNTSRVYISANNEIYYSDDNAQNFKKLAEAWGFQVIATDTVIYTLSDHDLRLSRDGGITWETHSSWIRCPTGASFTHLSITDKYYYVGSMKGLYRSTPALNNWMHLTNGPFYEEFWVDNVEAINRTVFALESFTGQRTYRSDNFGVEFYDQRSYCRLRKVDNTFYIFNDSIHFSSDQGNNWLALNFKTNHLGYCAYHKGDTIVVGGKDNNGNVVVDINHDHSKYWQDITDNLPDFNPPGQYIYNIGIFDGTIFIGYPEDGVWYRNDILTGDEELVNLSSENYSNIYPNPATNYFNIEFADQTTGEFYIQIFNLSGETMMNVTNNIDLGEKGSVDISEIPSGLYLYKLQRGDFSKSGKILIRRYY